ncbi:hypothetical protein EDD17DRAFT_1118418 [Pisolithus thermaeus]|nr:hypothetical protein EDD17DRAFT_1118418 [Pisolithus thermaeus]
MIKAFSALKTVRMTVQRLEWLSALYALNLSRSPLRDMFILPVRLLVSLNNKRCVSKKEGPPYHPDGSLAYTEMGDRLKEADQEIYTVSPAKTSPGALPADWGTLAELAADPASCADMCSSGQNLFAVLRSSISSKQIPHLMPVSSPWSSTDSSAPQTDPYIWTVADI